MPENRCAHIGAVTTVKHAKRHECEECIKIGGTWVHLAEDSWCRWVALQPWAGRVRAVAV